MYTEYTPTACMTYNTVCSQARLDTECVLVARELDGAVALYHLCAPKRIRHQVSHVIPLLVSSTSLLFQSTTAHSTTWTARPSPRRHLKTSANAIQSESNAKESLSLLNYESAGNLRPNTPTDQGVQHVCKFLFECLDPCTTGNRT